MLQHAKAFIQKNYQYIFIAIIVLIALKVFIPQLSGLVDSFKELRGANLFWVATGLVVFFAGLPIVTWQYMALALVRIPFVLTLRVQMAGLFVSKLLPSSLGTVTLNLYYLVQQKHTPLQSTAVMTMNALTGGIAYGILIVLALVFGNTSSMAGRGSLDVNTKAIVLILAGLVLTIVFVLRLPFVRQKISDAKANIRKIIHDYRSKPSAIWLGILLNGIGSFTSLFALYASARALGVDISLADALIAYTFGNIAAGLVPTPGGLGAAEAGIYAGLVLVGVDEASAISVTLLYRLISYWIPILPGYYFFWSLRKDVLSKFSLKNRTSTT